MPDPQRLRFGIIGCGLRGRLFGRALKGMFGVEVASVWDLASERSDALALELSARRASSLDDLVGSGLDAVVVATPDAAHVEPVEAAAARGIHIFLEKPVATTSADALRIRNAVRSSGVLCTVACLNRWHPAFASLISTFADGGIGNVVSLNARLSNSLAVPTRMLSWAASSSPGWFLMPHSLDLVVALAGEGPARVTAVGHRGVLAERGIDTWDALQAVIAFEGKSIASVESLWILPESSPSAVCFQFEAVGRNGAVKVEDSRQGLEVLGEKLLHPRTLVQDLRGQISGPNLSMITDFVGSVRSGKQCEPGVDTGVRVVQLIEAIHTSAEEKRSVDVSPLPP